MFVLPLLLGVVPLLLIVLFLQYRWQHRHILSVASKLQSPPTIPLIGNALYFLGDITTVTKNIVKFTTQFKGLFCIWVGPVPVFVASDPTDVQIVLNSSNTLEKDYIYDFLKPFLGDGLLTAPLHHWKKQRRLLSPMMHPSNVEKYMTEFNNVGADLAGRLSQSSCAIIDPRDSVFSIAVDAVMKTVIGRNPLSNEAKSDIYHLLNNVGKMFTYRLFKVWLHIDWLFNILYRRDLKEAEEKLAACIKIFDQEWKEAVEYRIQNPDVIVEVNDDGFGPKNIVELAVANAGAGTTKKDWLDEAITMIVGATDTVVSTISFLFLTLASHPDVQEKVRKEIVEVMGNSPREVTLNDIDRMPYLEQALMETMRIHGIFPCILRKVTKDIKLSESTLPVGSRVMVTLHAMGWDPGTFPEPERFKPERFDPEIQLDPDRKRHNYAFLPFSGGPRGCIGKKYAMMMMKTVAVHVLRRFSISTDLKLEDLQYELKVVMHSQTPLTMQFKPLLT